MLARSILSRFNRLLTAPTRNYNLHEYQSMEYMQKFGIPVPKGFVANTTQEAERVAAMFPDEEVVIKSQVLAGGRGKGHFLPSKFQGGVHVIPTSEVKNYASKMIGQRLITKQTGSNGKPCDMVLVQQKMQLQRELYLAILLDRQSGGPSIVCSTEGGMDIEEVAAKTPDRIKNFPISIKDGITNEYISKLIRFLDISHEQHDQFSDLIINLYNCFTRSDILQLEINPLGVTADNQILVCDAKLNFDDNAIFRQKAIYNTRDLRQEHRWELEAARYDLSYIGLDGNIGCLVNGAGLAMATMDLIKLLGGQPANFLDVGGGANEDQILNALRLLENNPAVDAILINIFGGILKCDVIAHGMVNATKKLGMTKPMVARLAGTNFKEAAKIIKESGISAVSIQDEEEAVKKVVGISQIIKLAQEIKVGVQFGDSS